MSGIIQPAEAAAWLKDPNRKICLLDVREVEEYAEVRIENTKLIPLGELLSRASRELNPDQTTIVYCAHGVRSHHGMMALKNLGFTDVHSLRGGIAAWIDQGLPVQP